MTRDSILPLLTVLIPAACAGASMLIAEKRKKALAVTAVAGAGLSLLAALIGFFGHFAFERTWAYWEMDFFLETSAIKAAILTALSAIALYRAIRGLKAPEGATRRETALTLVTIAMAFGAVLSENLVAMLFFWQALWLPVYLAVLADGEEHENSFRALATLAVADLCLMFGIGLAGFAAHTMDMGGIALTGGTANLAMALMAVGAMGKLGVFPFHGWRYRAGISSLLPGAVDILLGGYLLIRLAEMFPEAWVVKWVVAGLAIFSKWLALRNIKKNDAAGDLIVGGALAWVWIFADGWVLAALTILASAVTLVGSAKIDRQSSAPLDPYGAIEKCVKGFSIAALKVNDFISYVYDSLIPKCVDALSQLVRSAHNGSQARYVVWVLAGVVVTLVIYRFS